MSLSFLLQATRDHLRSELSPVWKQGEIECQPDGRPMPSFGKQYISIHPTSWTPGDIRPELMMGLDEYFSLSVTLTLRAAQKPRDRMMGDLYLDELRGMERISRQIILALHQNFDIITAANTLASHAGDSPLLIEHLRWAGTDASPRSENSEWFFVEPSDDYPVACLVMESRFRDARRVQAG